MWRSLPPSLPRDMVFAMLRRSKVALGIVVALAVTIGVLFLASRTSEVDTTPPQHTSAVLPVDADDPTWGSPIAPVTVVVFNGFECGECQDLVPVVEQVQQRYGPEKVRFVFKHVLERFRKKERLAAIAAATVHALGGDEAFWRFHDEAFRNQDRLGPSAYRAWAEASGVDGQAFAEALADERYADRVDGDYELAERLKIERAPTFFVNGIRKQGVGQLAGWVRLIEEQVLQAEELLRNGAPPADVYPTLAKKNLQPLRMNPGKPATLTSEPVFRATVGDSPTRGNAEAPVTMVIFGDFQCPYSKKLSGTVAKLVAKHGADLRVVWKDRPMVSHSRAEVASEFARAA